MIDDLQASSGKKKEAVSEKATEVASDNASSKVEKEEGKGTVKLNANIPAQNQSKWANCCQK